MAQVELYFMSPPRRTWALRGRANFRSREAAAVDPLRARAEWLRLAEAIEATGATVVALQSPSDELTGMPYAAECGHVVAGEGAPTFLLPRMASPHRRGERDAWAALARAMGLDVVDPAPEGTTWEAQGDVAELDGATLLFFGGRTNRAGMEGAARFMRGELLRIEIREPAFHGNMAVCPLPAVGKLLACPDVMVGDGHARLVERFGRDAVLIVSEDEIRRYATNALPIGRTLLAPTIVPGRVLDVCRDAGMEVVTLPMTELCEKAGGASRCLVSRATVDASVAARVPPASSLAAAAADIRADARGSIGEA